MHKQNNFSMFWTAEALLECYRLTSNKEYLDYGQRTLDELLMTLSIVAAAIHVCKCIGWFWCVECRWWMIHAKVFFRTHHSIWKTFDKPEYIERGYAALKASFVMMYCTENPQTKQQWKKSIRSLLQRIMDSWWKLRAWRPYNPVGEGMVSLQSMIGEMEQRLKRTTASLINLENRIMIR